MRRRSIAAAAAAAGAAGLALFAAGSASSQQVQRVQVINFPDVQDVRGEVEIAAPVPHSATLRREGLLVAPVGRGETGKLVSAGTVDTAGFTAVVLSLQGEVRSTHFAAGTIGALLVPDEEPIVRAFEQGGRLEFPLEVSAEAEPGDSAYFGAQQRRQVGFSRYRLYLYNTTGKSADANLYLYLTQ